MKLLPAPSACALAAALCAIVPVSHAQSAAARAWRTDPTWYDGLAEKCVYEATRTIYDKPRSYLATAYTNKELADPATTCKAEDGKGVEVFKHHWSERVPTESYDYDFSTMSYTRTADLSAWKLSVATQDDCGASHKEIWRDGAHLRWAESVYFPGGGRREGSLARGETAAFADALSLTLRDYDFEARPVLSLRTVPSQKDVHRVPFEPVERRVRYAKRAALALPIGTVDAHELVLEMPDGGTQERYWFAADGAAPRLHALVQYEGPYGVAYKLKSQERTAYWKR